MKIKVWNIWGIGNKPSQLQVWYNYKKERLDIVGILEPMVNLNAFLYCNMFGMNHVVSNCSNKIWVFVASSVDVEVIVDH